jgi:hypothetical protein
MKKGHYVMAVVTLILLFGFLLWLFQAPHAARSFIGLARFTNTSGQFFRVTNGYERAILLTELIVETNSSAGWRALSHTVPTHPQRLATGEMKDLVVAAPTNGEVWRLRVTYGKDVKGPSLWLGKAAYAVSHRTWPGQGFGIMAGGYSVISGEVGK